MYKEIAKFLTVGLVLLHGLSVVAHAADHNKSASTVNDLKSVNINIEPLGLLFGVANLAA